MNAVVDAIVIGAGPAGLSAALWLGRCGRSTLVYDSGQPRNEASAALHGFLTRDGTPPRKLRDLGRGELAEYPSVKVIDQTVISAVRVADRFSVGLADGTSHESRLLLLATGRTDTLPDIPDAHAFFGRGLFHCPYCDAWEHRGQPMAVVGHGRRAFEMARLLGTWSDDVAICTQGHAASGGQDNSCPIVAAPIVRLLAGADGQLAQLQFTPGQIRPCRALFFCSECNQKSDLPARLGCRFDADGSVVCDGHAATGVPGLFVAGNIRGGVHLAITAAAEGAEAALAMNDWLVEHAGARGQVHG